jgi:hypothetical protein
VVLVCSQGLVSVPHAALVDGLFLGFLRVLLQQLALLGLLACVVTGVLQRCHSGVTVVSYLHYSGATVMLQGCYTRVPLVKEWCHSGVKAGELPSRHRFFFSTLTTLPPFTVVLQWCCRGVRVVLRYTRAAVVSKWCSSGIMSTLPFSSLPVPAASSSSRRCYSGVNAVLQWCYTGVKVELHVLEWFYSSVIVVLQWCNSTLPAHVGPHVRVEEGEVDLDQEVRQVPVLAFHEH